MNAYKTLLAAATLVAGVAAVSPLVAQDTQQPQPSMSGEGLSRLQVEGKITDIDKGTNSIVIESKDFPGHAGAEMKLTYSVTDIALFDKFKDGDKVIADVIVTDKGPTVEALHVPGETPAVAPSTTTGDTPTTTPAPAPDPDRDAIKGDKSGDAVPADSTTNPKTDTGVTPDSSQRTPPTGGDPTSNAPVTPPKE